MPAFVSSKIESINHILCPMIISREAVDEFEQEIPNWIDISVQTHVLDFRKVQKIHPNFYKAVIKLKTNNENRAPNEKDKSRLITVNVSEEVIQLIVKSGMDKALNITKLNVTGKSAAFKEKFSDDQLRTWLVRYLITAARSAMNTMFDTTVAADENYRLALTQFKPDTIYRAAHISINCETIKANFRLFFDKTCLHGLIRVSLGEDMVNDEDLINSTAQEMLNLIYGGAKSHLNDDKHLNLPAAIPSLMPIEMAKKIQLDKASSLLLPFATALGTFHLQVEILK